MQDTKMPAGAGNTLRAAWAIQEARPAVYHERTPLWGQRWYWRREWIAQAARFNTIPALVVRGAAVAAAWALALGCSMGYGMALGLWILGVTSWA